MRLLRIKDNGEFSLAECFGDNIPPYAILSHTWGADDEEVTFKDIVKGTGEDKPGYTKIRFCGEQAAKDGLQYFWVDTCCINKDSSAELSEAINSMFQWYARSAVCYVCLSDLKPSDDDPFDRLAKCRWFTRGWTLQELIAPRTIEFYDQDWNLFGRKDESSMCAKISRITGADEGILRDASQLYSVPVGRRMSWAAKRKTTRVEDLAYCLLGIFDVNMPMLYGEGKKAFIRLQEEIARGSTDMTLFAWRSYGAGYEIIGQDYHHGIFAELPAEFADAGRIVPKHDHRLNEEFTLTNKGLRIYSVVGRSSEGDDVLPLSCSIKGGSGHPSGVGIYLKRHGPNMYARIRSDKLALDHWGYQEDKGNEKTIYISTKREQDVFSTLSPIRFGGGFSIGDITPIAPTNNWNTLTKAWMPISRGSFFTGLAELASNQFSDRVYILLQSSGKQHKPSVKLANQFLFDRVEIIPSANQDPPLRMQQMLHDVVVFSNDDKNKPEALLSVSITFDNKANIYVVDLATDTSCVSSLPSRSDYKKQVKLERGYGRYASEITVPNRRPGILTRRDAW